MLALRAPLVDACGGFVPTDDDRRGRKVLFPELWAVLSDAFALSGEVGVHTWWHGAEQSLTSSNTTKVQQPWVRVFARGEGCAAADHPAAGAGAAISGSSVFLEASGDGIATRTADRIGEAEALMRALHAEVTKNELACKDRAHQDRLPSIFTAGRTAVCAPSSRARSRRRATGASTWPSRYVGVLV